MHLSFYNDTLRAASPLIRILFQPNAELALQRYIAYIRNRVLNDNGVLTEKTAINAALDTFTEVVMISCASE